MAQNKKKLTFGVIGIIALIIIIVLFKNGPVNACDYKSFPTGQDKLHKDTLEVMFFNTGLFFGCKAENSDRVLDDNELPPSSNCVLASNAVPYEYPGRCYNIVDGPTCPPPYCIISLMESMVEKTTAIKIVISNADGSRPYECPAELVKNQTDYVRFKFDPDILNRYSGTFRITLHKRDGSTLSRTERFR